MSIVICYTCNRKTNSVFIRPMMEEIHSCLATWDDTAKRYVKGCGYDSAEDFDKEFTDDYLRIKGE